MNIRALLPFALACLFLTFASFSVGTARADVNLVQNPLFTIQPAGGLPLSCGAGCSYDGGGNAYGNCCTNDSTTIPDWIISAFTQAAGEESTGGSTALDPTPGGGSAYSYTSGGEIFQTVVPTIVGGDTYTLTAWVANYPGTYNQFVQSAYVYGSSAVLFGASATGVTSGYWTQLSGTYTTNASQTGDPLTVFLFNQGGAGQAEFADISLIDDSAAAATPEPGYYFPLALGLGVLIIAVRLRRAKQRA